MQITILSVSKLSAVTKAGKPYSQLEIAYKNEEGKVMGKKIMPFGDSKLIYDTLSSSQAGEIYEILSEKQGEYWVWVMVKKSDGSVSAVPPSYKPTPGGTVAKSTYETAEERARRQVMIVRQSSLSTAVAMLNAAQDKKTPINPDTVVEVAKHFEQYVLSTGETKDFNESLKELHDDVL